MNTEKLYEQLIACSGEDVSRGGLQKIPEPLPGLLLF